MLQHTQSDFDIQHYRYQGHSLSTQEMQQLKAAFSKRVPFYDYLFAKLLGNDRSIKIIDVPCGHGNLCYYLQAKGFTNYQGYDIDAGRVDAARKLGLRASVADGIKVVSETRDADVIFSLDFMEHLEREKAFEFASDCCRALKEGGIFIMRMPVTDSIRGAQDLFNDITHKWAANSQVTRTVLMQHGFSAVDIIDERPVPYKFVNIIRRGLFNVMSTLVNLFYLSLGFHKIRVWSTSCYFICRK